MERIDLTTHSGQHPRMGATRRHPFVPVEGVTLEDCAELARRCGRRIGEELGSPCFLYEAAATRPDRVSLADGASRQFEGLRDAIGRDPARAGPTSVPRRSIPPRARRRWARGASWSRSTPTSTRATCAVAKAVAAAVREQSGG
jgi:glutamate formiminotransferase